MTEKQIKALKRNGEYWKRRFEALDAAGAKYGVDAYKEIEEAFMQAQRDIRRDIDIWLSRLAKNNNVSLYEAKKMLVGNELKEFKWDVKQYIKYGKENAPGGKWMKQLENASAKFHISQLEAIKVRTQQSLEKAFGAELDIVDRLVHKTFTDGYYKSAFEIQKGLGIGWRIGEIDQRRLDKIVSKPWAADGKTFSDRIWSKKNKMINELHQELTRNCIYGRSLEDTIKQMEQYVDKSVKNARSAAKRLVVTENAAFRVNSHYEGLKEVGTEKYEIMLTIDAKTCPVCIEMNGKVFSISEFQLGVTAPPFHPNCETGTLVPVTEDWDEILNGEELGDTEFEEWLDRFVEGDKEGLTEVDKSENSGIINLYKGKGLSVVSDDDIAPNTIKAISEATEKVTSDFKILEKYSEDVRFSDVVGGLAENVYRPDTGLNVISLDKKSFSNPSELLEILKKDFISGKSYETDTIQSLIAHEMGHNAHVALALKRVGIEYGKPLSLFETSDLNEQYRKISEEIYNAAFKDELLQEIWDQCSNELGSITVGNPRELIAQSFGNYYFGVTKSKIAKKIVKYFMKELK